MAQQVDIKLKNPTENYTLLCRRTDILRNTYPDTIFIFILQANAKGESRGGPALDYDASMLIHMRIHKDGERFAYMKKSRTGTAGYRYYPNKDTVLLAEEGT